MVGHDHFGDLFIDQLQRLGVNADCVMRTNCCGTGVASIVIEANTGSNQIIVIPGANMHISDEDIKLAEAKGILDCRINANATLLALKLARAKGSVTILNPAPAPIPEKDSEIKGNFELLSEILQNSDFVCPNENEAQSMIGNQLISHSIGDSESAINAKINELSPCLTWLFEHGVKWPIITLGSSGVIALLSESECLPSDCPDVKILNLISLTGHQKQIIHLCAPKISDVVDTTGAGDCFIGALAYFVACHPDLSVTEQIRRSIWVASQSVRKPGTQISFPRRNELPKSIFSQETFKWPN